MAVIADDRTEPATPRRRQEARGKGQVARSHDLTAAIIVLTGLVGLRMFGANVLDGMLCVVAAGLAPQTPLQVSESILFLGQAGEQMARILGPLLLLVTGIGFASLFAQVGPLLTLQPVTPSLSKIDPIKGLQRLFSTRSLMLATIHLGKIVLVGAVAYISMTLEAAAVLFSSAYHVGELVTLGGNVVFELCMQIAVVLLVLAVADYAWQRYRHERELMMTKEEVKDELRSMEGDPAIRRRRRQLQMQLAMQRLQKDVPSADVIVTNPTHLAVAIRYDAETMIAPKVVAKGADQIAIRIRQIATRHSIPIIERRPLARALFESVQVGQYIPERFYQAIAEILAYIYELTGRSPRAARAALAGAT